MTSNYDQLHRILSLVLNSPYEGEKEKAVAVLLHRLDQVGLNLADLDATFAGPEPENTLRQRAGLAYDFEVSFRSPEEAMFYARLVERLTKGGGYIQWLDGHHIRCRLSQATRHLVDEVFIHHIPSLQQRIALAQKQVMSEYNVRRRALFRQAIEDEVHGL